MKDKLLAGIRMRGGSDADICRSTLGLESDMIREDLILSPGWTPDRLFPAESCRLLGVSPLFQYRIWDICHEGRHFTWLRAGFGAPVVMDTVILLGLTGCRRILFISSVGGLLPEHAVGDVLIPVSSVSGDGACRYLSDDLQDTFGEEQLPDPGLLARLTDAAERICREHDVRLHRGRPFCTDTIAAQYSHIPRIRETGCDCLDMESAAAFKAAALLDIPMAALLNISDNSFAEGKSLMSSRSEADRQYRKFVTGKVLPRIVLETFRP